MKKAKTVDITVVHTMIDGRKMYINGLSTRSWDGKYIINQHTPDINHAEEFIDLEHANRKITKLVNHHGRTYQSEVVTVPISRRHALEENGDIK